MARMNTKRPPTAAAPLHTADLVSRLRHLAMNLYWTWDSSFQRLFAGLDPALWEACGRNPLAVLHRLSPQRRAQLDEDSGLVALTTECEQRLETYLKTPTWFDRTAPHGSRRLLVAYFCSEYAIHDCLPQFAGGLGVLAGDHLKSASDLGIPLVAVGLLYRNGYYSQSLAADGTTRVLYPELDPRELPLRDTSKRITLAMGPQTVHARVWQALVGRTRLLLLDTYLAENAPEVRKITTRLYGGDDDLRIRQQLLLGVGGVLALDALRIEPTVFHLNEGHAAFCQLQRLRAARIRGLALAEARERVSHASVFTTHTPVPAGNQRFDNQLVMKYLSHLARDLRLKREELLDLGRETPGNKRESFCMTVLALRLARYCNGVAALHGQVSREMWLKVYGAKKAADVPIGHVTNGIHSRTWLAPECEALYERYLKPEWFGAGPDDDWWQNVERIPAGELWALRGLLRRKLVQFAREQLRVQALRRGGDTEELTAALQALDENTLTIGFARRFATYKRAPLIFHDARRLAAILHRRGRAVQFVFAGKAHPADLGGQAYAQEIYTFARENGFRGKIVLLENYDMRMGQMLTAGVDVWLNNPLRPQEASGTSGMKPPLHGGLNLSIPDGWWPEGYNGRNGWQIGDGRALRSRAAQDRYDANELYGLLERRVVPAFYERDRNGLPQRWIALMRASMQSICAAFSTHRMLANYLSDYYTPAHNESGVYPGAEHWTDYSGSFSKPIPIDREDARP